MRLVSPNQITGVISTPPIGLTNFLVIAKNGSVGNEIKGQRPLLRFIFGYQVRIIRIRKESVRAPRRKPSNMLMVGRYSINRFMNRIKASLNTHTSYKFPNHS